MQQARFFVGQLVRHLKFDYRGVVADADPVFMGTAEWYDTVAKSRPPKDRPWYRVLVDGSDAVTYVAERHLAPDDDDTPIKHPDLDDYLADPAGDGVYAPRRALN